MGAVSATTLLSLAWFTSLLVFFTTMYMLIAFPAWKIDGTASHSASSQPVADRTALKGTPPADITVKGLPGETDAATSKSEDGEIVKGIMARASRAISDIKVRLVVQARDFSELSPSRLIFLLLGMIWGLAAPFCMHARGRAIRANRRIGEDKESFVGRKQLKCISLVTIAVLFSVLGASYLLFKDKFSFPDARLLFPVVFSTGCLAGSLILLCLLAADFFPFARQKKDNHTVAGERGDTGAAWHGIVFPGRNFPCAQEFFSIAWPGAVFSQFSPRLFFPAMPVLLPCSRRQ
jgi:hypothetical protein